MGGGGTTWLQDVQFTNQTFNIKKLSFSDFSLLPPTMIFMLSRKKRPQITPLF